MVDSYMFMKFPTDQKANTTMAMYSTTRSQAALEVICDTPQPVHINKWQLLPRRGHGAKQKLIHPSKPKVMAYDDL